MGRTQLTREVGLYKATVWLEPIPVNQLFGQKNYLVLTCKSTATTITTRPQTCLQSKQGHTASPSEDDMITIEKNEHQNTKQFPHHSVQIYVGYVDNIMTLYCLRCPSGRPLDYT